MCVCVFVERRDLFMSLRTGVCVCVFTGAHVLTPVFVCYTVCVCVCLCVWNKCLSGAGRAPRHYLNGSHFRVCHHFSEAAISVQTDRQKHRQRFFWVGWGGLGWGGERG